MNKRIYIAATGAGSGAQSLIWMVPGCSSYFAGATFPYGEDKLEEFLGYRPEKFVHPDVAIDMAMRAYQEAWRSEDDEAVGIGCSAAVATNRLRKGDYVGYVAYCDRTGVYLHTCRLEAEAGRHARIKHDAQIDFVIHDAAKALGPKTYNWIDTTPSARHLLMARPYWRKDSKRLLEHAFEREIINHATDSSEYVKRPLFPGAFNPPHVAHFEIAETTNAAFNIELSPPHKEQLHVAEVLQRLKLLRYRDTILTDGCPLYLDKSNRYQNHPIVMGADAFIRMMDPKWGPSPKEILTKFSQNCSRIYVFGRMVDGKYISANEAVSITEEVGIVFDVQPVSGRWDISSSDIRKGPKR